MFLKIYAIVLMSITFVITKVMLRNERNGVTLQWIALIAIGIFDLIIMKTKFEFLYSYNGITNGYYGGGTSLETIFIALIPPILIILISNTINRYCRIRQLEKMKENLWKDFNGSRPDNKQK